MKTTNTIQRLCLFLLLIAASLMGAHAQTTVTINSTDFKKNEDVHGYHQYDNFTLYLGKCKISGAGNIFELEKDEYISINASDDYNIREIVLEDTEGGDDWDEGGLNRIGYYSDHSYSMAFVKNSGSKPDDNNIVFYNYDAPANYFYIKGHNMKNKGKLKFRRITVTYVKVPEVRFIFNRYDLRIGEGKMPNTESGGHPGAIRFTIDNTDVATCDLYTGYITSNLPGWATIKATWLATGGYAKVSCTADVNVMRDELEFKGSHPARCMFTNGIKAGEVLYNYFDHITVTTSSQRPFDFDNPEFSVTSDNPAVITVANAKKGTLTFGGSVGTATVTVSQKENRSYDPITFTYTISVLRSDKDGTVLIKDLDEYKLFASLVNDQGLSATIRLENDINLGKEILMVGTSDHPYSGTLDGKGHTLSFDWNTNEENIAPFRYTGNASIKNLNTQGQITTSNTIAAGLVGTVNGPTTISSCVSDVDITSTGEYYEAAGFVGECDARYDVTINDCIAKGTM